MLQQTPAASAPVSAPASAVAPHQRRSAALALLLLVPVPTVSVLVLLFILPGPAGKVVAGLCKLWIALLPVAWLIFVDKKKPGFPFPTRRGMGAALITGVIIFAAMLAGFFLLRPYIPVEPLLAKARETGFDHRWAYLGMFVYIIAVNSLLEEYVWRWFVFRRFEILFTGPLSPRWAGRLAVVAAGLAFTVHHVFALAAWVPPMVNALASLGVFIGGATWTALYLRYRSIWPGYLSHVCADLAVFVMGWSLIFGE